MEKIETYLKIIAYAIIVASAIILLIKICIAKLDKNKDGKISKEEIEESNYNYVMSFLIDTIKIITKGIVQDTGCKVTTAEKMINKVLKNQNSSKIEKEIKTDFETQEKIKEQEERDRLFNLEMLKKQKLAETIKELENNE